jgi:glycosyltransferase EpsE
MDKKISVIMATYNCEKTVEKSIDSILAQTYSNWVMIICDDGSSDGTLAILNRYASDYPEKFIIIRNKQNSKLPYSLNHCLQYVQTELVARMDGDDWSTPDRFEKQVSFLTTHPQYDLVGTGVSVFDGEKKIASIIKTPTPTKDSMLRDNAFSHATIMTYKRVYDALDGYSLDPTVERVEDVDLWCRFLAAGFKGYNLPDELYVILEDINAVKRRTFQARLNSAKTRCRGYKLMGFRGVRCYLPYLLVLKAFVPAGLHQKLHNWMLRRKRAN